MASGGCNLGFRRACGGWSVSTPYRLSRLPWAFPRVAVVLRTSCCPPSALTSSCSGAGVGWLADVPAVVGRGLALDPLALCLVSTRARVGRLGPACRGCRTGVGPTADALTVRMVWSCLARRWACVPRSSGPEPCRRCDGTPVSVSTWVSPTCCPCLAWWCAGGVVHWVVVLVRPSWPVCRAGLPVAHSHSHLSLWCSGRGVWRPPTRLRLLVPGRCPAFLVRGGWDTADPCPGASAGRMLGLRPNGLRCGRSRAPELSAPPRRALGVGPQVRPSQKLLVADP